MGASEQVQADIDAKTYQPWVRQVAEPHGEETGGGTPYVEIDGTTYEEWSTPGALREAVQAAGGGPAPSDGGGAAPPRELEGADSLYTASDRPIHRPVLRWSGATVAHLSCKQVVAGSIPVSSSHLTSMNAHQEPSVSLWSPDVSTSVSTPPRDGSSDAAPSTA